MYAMSIIGGRCRVIKSVVIRCCRSPWKLYTKELTLLLWMVQANGVLVTDSAKQELMF